MISTIAAFQPTYELHSAVPNGYERIVQSAFGANLTIARGQALARKTSDTKMYPLNIAATDGTQTFAGFSQISLATDANGTVWPVVAGTNSGTFYWGGPSYSSGVFAGGIFNPDNLQTSIVGTAVAEVDTVTPAGTITAADNFVIELPGGNTVNFVAVSGSVTPTNIVTGLKTAWAADPTASALATATGTATLVLTSKFPGQPMNLATYCEGVGTFVNVITTAATPGLTKEVDTWTLTTNPSTGDTFTLTISYPGLQTYAVTATVGSTQTVAAATVLIAAAWNADPIAAAYAAATSTATTVVLTAVTSGTAMNVAMTTTSATTTIAKAVTTPATGRNIADIIPGCPGAHIDPVTGYWVVPG